MSKEYTGVPWPTVIAEQAAKRERVLARAADAIELLRRWARVGDGKMNPCEMTDTEELIEFIDKARS